ncbi:hypothetical protein MBLNU230_g8559t1 [Neophaeotheca triangularis]
MPSSSKRGSGSPAPTHLPIALWDAYSNPAPEMGAMLSQAAHFLEAIGYHKTFAALLDEAAKAGIDVDIVRWDEGVNQQLVPSMQDMWDTWADSAGEMPKMPAYDDVDPQIRAAVEGVVVKPVTDDSSSASSSSDKSSSPDPTPSPKKKDLKRKRSVSSSSSSSDSGSSNSSSSDSDSDSDSSSSSSSDSDARPAKRSKVTKSDSSSASSSSESEDENSSSSDSDSSSEASSDDVEISSVPNKSDSSSSSSSDSSDSDSDSGSKKKQKKAAIAIPIEPESGASSATLGRDSPQAKPTDTLVITAEAAPAPSNGAIHPSRLSRVPKGNNAVIEQTTTTMPASAENIAQLKKVPFSRIPQDTYVDPRFSSNAYQSYDYADRAFQDLSVTKGKGFTKEKNKKKKGAYRGGAIDLAPKGIKFED